MRGPLFLLPFGIVSIIQGMVSIGRINSFLNLEEINPNNVSASTYSSHTKRSIGCVAVCTLTFRILHFEVLTF